MPFKSNIIERLTTVMQIRGISEKERLSWLKEQLQVDISSASRKLKGQISLSLEEIKHLSVTLDCSSDYLLGLSDNVAFEPRLMEMALRKLGVLMPLESSFITIVATRTDYIWQPKCIAWITEKPCQDSTPNLVAWQDQQSWCIGSLPSSKDQDITYHAVQAILETDFHSLGQNLHIAVLDDREEAAYMMQDFLHKHDYKVSVFTKLEELLKRLPTQLFDGFILDWSLGQGQTSEPLLGIIRNTYGPQVPIILLTGKASELEIESAIIKYQVRYFTKEGRLRPILAQLKQDLGQS